MSRYRVEHHVEHQHASHTTPLGLLETAFPHHTTLEPYLRPLLEAGATGWLVLIDATSGLVVARRRVLPGPPSRWARCRAKSPARRMA